MTRSLVLLADAEEELAAASSWYERRRPGLGREFVEAVDDAFATIVENPFAARVWKGGRPYRMHVLHRFPFVVFFVVLDEAVEVVAVAHGRRRPGYWLDDRR